MADSISKEEISLPLSQETYLQLFRELNGIPLDTIMNDDFNVPIAEDNSVVEDLNNTSPTVANNPLEQYIHYNIPDEKRIISSLPASENWPGDFDFNISFSPQSSTKGVSWIYSKDRNKLYVGKEVPCPVNFSTNTAMPPDVVIRAMALFSSSDNAGEIVTRCVNHSLPDIKKNLYEAEHFIRAESRNAVYQINDVTKRHSVIIPYENPAGSCAGGPNRRPLMVVFTLERGYHVLGRQRIDLKVCTCPVRDFKSDEKKGVVKENKPPVKRQNPEFLTKPEKKLKIEDHDNYNTEKPLKKPEKDVKMEDYDNHYYIKVKDRDCYNFLRKMKRLYDIYRAVNTHPNLRNMIYLSSATSGDEKTDS